MVRKLIAEGGFGTDTFFFFFFFLFNSALARTRELSPPLEFFRGGVSFRRGRLYQGLGRVAGW